MMVGDMLKPCVVREKVTGKYLTHRGQLVERLQEASCWDYDRERVEEQVSVLRAVGMDLEPVFVRVVGGQVEATE